MKKLFLFLLLANVALALYGYYLHVASRASADAERFRPVNDESVKVLTPQQVAKLGPAKVAQLTLACAEWGPLNDPELTRAKQLLEPLGLGRTINTKRVDVTAEHWVYIPPKANKAAAERALAELGRLNVTDTAIVTESGQWQWSISLGVYRTRAAADNRFEEVRQKGVKTATYRSREQSVTMTAIVLREPQQGTLQKLEEFKTQIPGSTVTTGACPENR